jgi:hypothetical protein
MSMKFYVNSLSLNHMLPGTIPYHRSRYSIGHEYDVVKDRRRKCLSSSFFCVKTMLVKVEVTTSKLFNRTYYITIFAGIGVSESEVRLGKQFLLIFHCRQLQKCFIISYTNTFCTRSSLVAWYVASLHGPSWVSVVVLSIIGPLTSDVFNLI